MTSEQKAKFDELWLAEQPCSRRLGAPAGSGKSFIAVKLAARSVCEQLGSGGAAPVLRRPSVDVARPGHLLRVPFRGERARVWLPAPRTELDVALRLGQPAAQRGGLLGGEEADHVGGAEGLRDGGLHG